MQISIAMFIGLITAIYYRDSFVITITRLLFCFVINIESTGHRVYQVYQYWTIYYISSHHKYWYSTYPTIKSWRLRKRRYDQCWSLDFGSNTYPSPAVRFTWAVSSSVRMYVILQYMHIYMWVLRGEFGTALLYVFQLRSTFFSQTVSAPRTQFEKKGWSCENT